MPQGAELKKKERQMNEQNKSLAVATPATLVSIAIEKGADIEKLEKLMELQTRWEQAQSQKAYSEAMAAFKANPPNIKKDKKVKFRTGAGETSYNHASLWNVTEKISAALSQHGLSASWTTSQEASNVTVTCRISHIDGHSEETSLTAAPDTSGNKNSIQALGSTISYLERYTLLALTGLATQDMDDDGQGGGEIKLISDKQKSTIIDMINAKEIDEDKFLKYMDVDLIENIAAANYNKAMAALRAAKGKGK